MPHAALDQVRQEIITAAQEVGRPPSDIELVAVSKTYQAEDIRPVLEAGQRAFGENRVQEALAKWPPLRLEYPDIGLHLIGPLQSNKTRDAVGLFDAIHSIDRPKIAKAIAAEMHRQAKKLRLFVQVNTGEEAQKAGIGPAEVSEFLALCRDTLKLEISGLMCIPPVDEEASVHFALLAKLAHTHGLQKLSMGMSSDYTMAIKFGATHVRVGSAIFGARS